MIKKSIVAITVILVVLAAALIFANYTNNNNSTDNSINHNSNPEKQISTTSTSNNANAPIKNTLNTAKSQIKISPEEAKKIAQENNEVTGEIAGTPTLSKEASKYMYIVPFFTKNGTNTGYIGVDAQTGQTEEIWELI